MYTLAASFAAVNPTALLPFMAPVAAPTTDLERMEALYDADDSWIMSDAEADQLAYESDCQDRYESGSWAF